MSVSTNIYRKLPLAVFNKEIDWAADTIKVTLHTNSYTPNYDTHDYQNVLSNELSTAGGYTAGGATLASCTQTYTAADSWGTARANSTAYVVGDLVRPATGNGYLYRCSVAGTSHSSAPTFPTVVGQDVTEGGGTVQWTCVGSGVVVFDAADTSWAAATFTARRAVIADTTPAAAASNPLICCIDFGEDKSPSAGTFQITYDADGIFYIPIP